MSVPAEQADRLAQMDIDPSKVLNWHGRSLRTLAERSAPKTYWEEFVETDEWYVNELTVDVPPDELHAACFEEVEAAADASEDDFTVASSEEEECDLETDDESTLSVDLSEDSE